ncbi:AlkA N-terminal domain-containing protein [Nesterenkonia sp. NBAIMH1]|uniref:AlkA N-terminal domain-containing protein n=1 Tax=Nesterenkonia sp. NBAIMH1 TaxID=2600320 RepID=UPI0011B7FAD0|nr:AlkA N-terminal domain-containing protein [Nesterenkonia sp. NBAIMH1]
MTMVPRSFDERYRAVEARDSRFDGQFIMAVRTTGIYCRPSCPARTPKRENAEFYLTSAAAHEAGYRACRRCLPDAVPGSPEWNVRQDTVGRAMRLIAEGVVERDGVHALSARLGYSPRHLTRLLTEELGAGPLALARSHRAHSARLLLTSTELTIADVAFSAGFGSIRQCNDTLREVFGMTPTELRARRRGPAPAPGSIHLVLPVREPFDLRGTLRWMADRAIPGMEAADATGFARTLLLPGGPARFALREDPGRTDRLRLQMHVTELSDVGMLAARARRLFDLDADPLAIDAALSGDPRLSPLVARTPGIRVPGVSDPHEMLIRAMIGQQISVAAARTMVTSLVHSLGDVGEDGTGEPQRFFPSMETIAERGHEALRGPAARIRAITRAAAALADGTLTLGVADDSAELRARLLAQPGIGPWTADYVRMRVAHDPDVFLPGDSAMRGGARRAGLPAETKALTEWASRSAPWRSYVTAHLWRAALSPRQTTSPTPPAREKVT